MSNHFSADNLKFPGDDRRLDLTDVYIFTSADDADKTVLIIDSNPTSAPPPIPAPVTGPEFYPGAFYRINIDNDGDNHADVAFTFVFSEVENGKQTGTARYATGAVARQLEPAGEVLAENIPVSFDSTAQPILVGRIRLCAGLRSDPFFADVEGALHGFVWTGHDDFADNNVDSITLEVPSDMLGGPVIGVWATVSRYQDGVLEQLDRGGNPTINPFINPDGEKNLYNSRQPADDVANYLGPWSVILENAGGLHGVRWGHRVARGSPLATRWAGSASGPTVSQPKPTSARCSRIGENSASSGVSIQVMATPAESAAERSREAVWTARESGRSAGRTTRSRGRPKPAACRVWLTPWSTAASTSRAASSRTAPAAVSCTPSRPRCSSGVPRICSSRRICWLRVGWAMNNRSAARVKVPASATATRYRRCRSSRPCGACVSARGSRAGSACACFMSVTYARPWLYRGTSPRWV